MLLYFLSSKDMIFLILHKKSVRSIIHAHILIHSKVKEKMQIHSITPTRIYMRNTVQTDCLPKLSGGLVHLQSYNTLTTKMTNLLVELNMH